MEPGVEGPGGQEPRFFADAMLGRLARWLRALGYDTAYEARIEDEELVRRALEEGRRILTRDARLPREWTVEGVLVLRSDHPLAQLRTVVEKLRLEVAPPFFTRCLVCNAELRETRARDVAGRVPERVLETHDRFLRCPECQRIYWEGSHVRRMRRRLRSALEGLRGSDPD